VHGEAGELVIGGELPDRWEPVAGPERPACDAVSDLIHDLLIQGRPDSPFERQSHHLYLFKLKDCLALAPAARPLVAGMERADSLAFDLHKWGYQPYEAGCVLVRDARSHHAAFAFDADYLAHDGAERGTAGGGVWLSDYGVQLSRGFRALKVWMALSVHGVDKLGRLIQQNIDQARYLEMLVERTPELELMAPVPLNVVCFRFVAPDLDEAELDLLNEELVIRIQESGVAVPSGTRVKGRYVIRCAITNHRSRREDFDALVDAAVRLGRELLLNRAS
jgi:glutamate/tyrosine decarboxylase-like PLP-dependent enzyme